MAASSKTGVRRPGPRRPEGYPAGPDEVRRAVLDVAGRLFAERGVDAVALRDVADAANVHHTLIARYIGNRETLIRAVFDDLSEQVASAVAENPLAGQGYGLETAMGRWVRVAGSLAISGRPLVGQSGFNPVVAMAETLEASYGQDPQAARFARGTDRRSCARLATLRGLPRRSRSVRRRRTRHAPRGAPAHIASTRRDALAVAARPAHAHVVSGSDAPQGPKTLGGRSGAVFNPRSCTRQCR